MIALIYEVLLIYYTVLGISRRKTSKSSPPASFIHLCGEDKMLIQGIYL